MDPVHPFAREISYSLFTAEASARFDEQYLLPRASSLLGLRVGVQPSKRFVHGAIPNADVATIELEGPDLPASTVRALIFPIERARDLKAQALAVGSMGMETLVVRARRVLQVHV